MVHVGRAGSGHIWKCAKVGPVTPGDCAAAGADSGTDVSAFQPVGTVVLIVNHQVKQQIRHRCQSRDQPGGQAVGIHRDLEPGRVAVWRQDQFTSQLGFQQADVFGMFGEPDAGRGAGTGGAAQNQGRAGPFLQCPDPLRDGRRCYTQLGRGALKRTEPQNCRQCREVIGVELH